MRINLKKCFFTEKEFVLAENDGMRAVAFRYSTGVEALRIENSSGYFIILPFQGQQVWRAEFCGKQLTMKSMFDEPVPNTEYLKTYGGFILHCGICAFGVPQEGDTHELHGELPNAEYRDAYIECGDEYIAVGGHIDYNKTFDRNYTFSPECRLYKDDSVLKLNIGLENRRNEPMEYMYLCHINFRPFDGAELMYSADYLPENFKVFKLISDKTPKEQAEKLLKYMEEIEQNPAIHHKIGAEGEIYDPEICMAVKYKGDKNGRAYTLQLTNDGACYVSHPVDVLPEAIRWISRRGEDDAMGMVLPATAEHLGYTNAKKNGQIKILGAKEKLEFVLEVGYIGKTETASVMQRIENIING
ncbi:MAG: DUF4432 family protein [Clostridia bacterium]|nr:DUF4432 family protein [Clostridia bacterium]